MCGFIQRVTDHPAVIDLLIELGLTEVVPHFKAEKAATLNFYPAFGQNPDKKITNVIVNPSTAVNSTWWFDCKEDGKTLAVGKRTTFNARNLDSPFWKNAIQHHRAIIVATAIGESKGSGSDKQQFLMKSDTAFILGAVYRQFSNGCYSTSLITRPPHERFSRYHDKSIPFFLPKDKQFVEAWLNSGTNEGLIWSELDNPKLHTDLTVTQVKTF